METDVNYEDKHGEPIKLFVGQIPKSWEESDVRQILEPYGPIQELTVLKDRATGLHRGCAFVMFVTRQAAVDAQKNLHEKKTLPGMNHPMQVKPATHEHKATPVEDRRLFVGMLAKNLTEEDVKALFAPCGHVEDVSILRNAEGKSKGAAFVRMGTKTQALQAITALHQSQTMHGCSAPLVVKVADTDREKNARRLQQTMVGLGGVNNIGLSAAAFGLGTLGAAAYYQQLLQLQQATQGATANNSFGLGTSLGNNLALAALAQQSAGTIGVSSAPTSYTTSSSATGLGNLGSAALGAATSPSQKSLGMGGLTNDTILQAYLGMQQSTPGSQPTPAQQPPQPLFQQPQFTGFGATPSQQSQANYIYQKQKEGPEGSNLFIYHLPNDVTDPDLIQMFAPFGNVISAKVFIDKVTSLSKCFGFVSYDNALSAQSAIQSMNGFQIGTKRLKVQLKRPKDANKPYW